MSEKWYGAIEKVFDGSVTHESWRQDGHHYEEVTVLLPDNEIHAVRVDGDNGNILLGIDHWTTYCSADELSPVILNRLDLHG